MEISESSHIGVHMHILIHPSIHPSIYPWLYSPFLLDLGRFFSFLILYTVGRTPWTGDQPVASPLPTHTTSQTRNKRTQTSTPGVGFEPTIPVFERAKTVHALPRGHCHRHMTCKEIPGNARISLSKGGNNGLEERN
jgi:hypothetical protein